MQRHIECDVAVVGGGAAGIAAAIGASRTGARTVLIERNPYFGGQATNSQVTAYCGFFTRGENYDQVYIIYIKCEFVNLYFENNKNS